MSDIIRSWLEQRLGIIFDANTVSFPTNCQDGRILAEILYSYHVITLDQLNQIHQTDKEELIHQNFQQLKVWLNSINIPIGDEIENFGKSSKFLVW